MSNPSSESSANTPPITLLRRKGSRRMTLRLHPVKRMFTLSLPMRASMRDAERFLREKKSWIERQWSELPHPVPFADGMVIPLLGDSHTIRHIPAGRGVVACENFELCVSGTPEHLPRRLRDWLKQHLRRDIQTLAAQYAEQLEVKVRRVGVRDTSSRWGSCSQDGNLSFSWRLVFAPRDVMAYVVAHEVAHLREMNHSPRFWKHVEAICPEWETHYVWLREQAGELYRYG